MSIERETLTALVLCGGDSRRMGRDKALVELEGRTLLQRAIDTVEPLAAECLLACGPAPRYAHLGHRLVLDGERGGGPLVGLAAGLAAARTEWLLVLACDLPRVDRPLLEGLLGAAEDPRQEAPGGGPYDVVLYEDRRGLHPLCALYRRSVLGAVRSALAAGERRMASFWDRPGEGGGAGTLRVRRLPTPGGPDSRVDPRGVDLLMNLNTPGDLERAGGPLAP